MLHERFFLLQLLHSVCTDGRSKLVRCNDVLSVVSCRMLLSLPEHADIVLFVPQLVRSASDLSS